MHTAQREEWMADHDFSELLNHSVYSRQVRALFHASLFSETIQSITSLRMCVRVCARFARLSAGIACALELNNVSVVRHRSCYARSLVFVVPQ
eukprot:6194818-Pleurochrysis_carterae.AAC.4